ncbi:hypothetical protein TrST_g14247 [Triparma strigata]|uniref:Uncharacterized protein n=1 Tax=Triparma strigata TaxID=1606541 RepID=A0A9W7F3E9_9STRA|nr:hypothetical protein TrST_g14247 [Triparma strigata]
MLDVLRYLAGMADSRVFKAKRPTFFGDGPEERYSSKYIHLSPILGFNPSLARAPKEVREVYADAKYVVLSRATIDPGPSQCLWPPLTDYGKESIEGIFIRERVNKLNRQCIDSKAVISVIDTSFEVLGQMSLDQGQLPGDYCICDGRLFQVHPEGHEDEDEILVGFNPDLGRMSTEGCVTRLSFEALDLEAAAGNVPNLMGKVSAPLVSVVSINSKPHKNMGLANVGGVIYGFDSVAPAVTFPLLEIRGGGSYSIYEHGEESWTREQVAMVKQYFAKKKGSFTGGRETLTR